MLARSILAAAAFAVAAVPTPQRYRVETRGTAGAVKVTSGPDGGENATTEIRSYTMRAILAVTIADTAGGRAVAVSVDSLVNDPPRVYGMEGDGAPTTGTWKTVLAPGGALVSFAPGRNGVETRPLDDLVATLVPNIPAGTRVGDTWSDSSRFTVVQPEGPHTTQVITRYRAAGRESVNGVDALRIEGEFTVTRSARFNGPSGEIAIETTAAGTVTRRIGPDRSLLDSRIVRHLKSVMTLPSSAPVSSDGADTTTITLLR